MANIAAGVSGFDPGTGSASAQTNNVWKSTQGAIALGDASNNITRQLTGLAAGTNDSDAVNVAQLKTVTNQTFKLQANNDTASSVKTSDTVQFLDGKNINITRSGNNITVKTVDAPTFTTVTTGNSKLDNTGLTITGGPSVTTGGINAANTTISGVANATTADQAVNKGQLDTVSTQANKAITFTGNARKAGDTTDVNRKLGETIAISGTATTAGTYSGANVKTVTDQTGAIAIQIADAPSFAGTVTSTGLQVNGNSNVTGSSTIGSGANAVTLTATTNGLDVGAKKITNVADATLTSDAVNKGQLDATSTSLTNKGLKFGNGTTNNQYKLGDTINVKASADGSITSTTTADGVQLGLGNSITVGTGANAVTVNGTTGRVTGLSNKTWNGTVVSGQAATEDQLKTVSDAQTATDNAAVITAALSVAV